MSYIDIKTELSGLLPFEKYDYKFEGMGGNWPCTVTPYSGSIRPYGSTMIFEGKVHFCSAKTACSGSSGILPYSDHLCESTSNLFTTLRLSLKPESFPHTLYTNTLVASCADCFPQPSITTPASINLNRAQGNEYTLISSIVGLQPNETYTYNFESIDANWPVKINPISGLIKTSKDRTTITSNVMFCNSTGLCNNGDDILDYTVTSSCLLEKNLYSIIQLSIVPSETCEAETVVSSPIPMYCKDCLPSVNVKILPTTRKTVSLSENISGLLLEPVISGIEPNKKYSYVFKGISSNWPVFISPISGILQSSTPSSSLSSQLFFCSSTGVCASGTRGVLDYRLDAISSGKINNDPFVNLQLELTSLSCGTTYTSDTLMLYCNDCLSKSDPRIVTSRIT
jgi:hypothetical protein